MHIDLDRLMGYARTDLSNRKSFIASNRNPKRCSFRHPLMQRAPGQSREDVTNYISMGDSLVVFESQLQKDGDKDANPANTWFHCAYFSRLIDQRASQQHDLQLGELLVHSSR